MDLRLFTPTCFSRDGHQVLSATTSRGSRHAEPKTRGPLRTPSALLTPGGPLVGVGSTPAGSRAECAPGPYLRG